MSATRTVLTLLTAATLSALGAVPASGAPPAAPPAAAVPVLAWTPCPGELAPTAECATARVPLVHAEPQGAQIDLALRRVPAADPGRRIGTLFVNPGGPGGSGVGLTEFTDFIFTGEVRARFDVLGFDPRGVAGSTPLRCFDSFEESVAFYSALPAFPVTAAQERAVMDQHRRYGAACRERSGALMANMTTADVARDMDLLRAAVGDGQLSYLGFSYGTQLGSTYAALFPGRVRALVLDGVLDPVEWTTGGPGEGRARPFSTRLQSSAGAASALRDMLRRCAQTGPERCAFAEPGVVDLVPKWEALLADLDRAPRRAPGGPFGDEVLFDRPTTIALALIGLYDGSRFPFLTELLQGIADADPEAMATGVQRVAAQRQATDRRRPGRGPAPEGAPAGGEPYTQIGEGFSGVVCGETDNPRSEQTWGRVGRADEARNAWFGRLWTWVSAECASWPVTSRSRYTGPFDRPTSTPVLVVGTTQDPATRYAAAQQVARRLPGAHLLTLDGPGHTAYALGTPCVDAVVDAYLLRQQLPAQEVTCAFGYDPFAPPEPPSLPEQQASALRDGVAGLLVDRALRR